MLFIEISNKFHGPKASQEIVSILKMYFENLKVIEENKMIDDVNYKE